MILGVTIERELSNTTQRTAVIGDADFAATEFLGNGSNQSFTESLFLWLMGDSEDIDFVTQRAPDSELNLSTTAVVSLSAVYLVGFPALSLLLGGWIRWRRRAATGVA